MCTMAEEDLNVEPREPLELRMCMSDEWRDRLVVERLSQHIAYCPRVQCGDQICRYFSWFARHYNQCAKPDCQSCPKYRQWMTYHSKSCTPNSGCLLIHCPEFKTQQLRHQFRLLSQDAPEALTITRRLYSEPSSVTPDTHCHSTVHVINRPCCSAILHRENLLDLPPIGGEQDVIAFARNNSLTSQQLRYRSQSSASSQGSIVAPEASVRFSKDHAQIVTSNTTDKEDNEMESFHPQQRRETGYLRGVDVIGETSITITSQAQTINWKGYGLKLHIPQDSLPPDFEQCRLLIKVLSGQFTFPENTSLVSAVYWLDSDPGIIFSKPLTLEIQHCASNTSRLSFVWAKCTQKHLPDTFKAVEKGEFFPENVYGRVQLNHFSLWGIVCEWWEWFSGNQQLLYCAHLYYMNKEINLRHIYFVITRNLEVNITYVKNKYGNSGATTDECDEGMPVEFESNSISLELPSDEVTLGEGWKILPCFTPKITKKEVDNFNPGRRIPSCKLKAEWTKPSKPSPLTHKVNLEGAKDNSYFLIELNSTPPGLRKSTPGSTNHSHHCCHHEQPSSSLHHASILLHHHNGCPRQEWSSEPSIICRDDKPSLCKLLKYPGKHRRINISEEISTNYKKFGTFLLKDDNGTIVSGIERAKIYNADETNGAILEKWIGGKGQQPVTWDTLVKCLRDIDLAVLADEIEEVLQ